MRFPLLGALVLVAVSFSLSAQERGDGSDLAAVGRIKAEAFENSQVMETAEYLSDRYGPRLTASPEWREAADWAVKRLQSYGLENVHLEKWGAPGRGWSLKKASVEMLEPRYSSLVAAPLAWSDVTHGIETGDAVLALYGSGRRVPDPKKRQDELDKFIADWKGKLKGKIVLLSSVRPIEPGSKPLFTRYTNQELSDLADAPAPLPKVPVDLRNVKFPDTENVQELSQFNASLPPAVREQFRKENEATAARRAKFFKEEGVTAILQSDQRAHDGLLFAEAAGPYDAKDVMAPPTREGTSDRVHFARSDPARRRSSDG
jgi:carboxypeptidase Q